MLILTRKSDESIVIGRDIVVKVLRVQRHQVQLGISAPREVTVYRQEIYDQVIQENRKAASEAVGNERVQESLQQFRGLLGGEE